jgi:hypothetical protein
MEPCMCNAVLLTGQVPLGIQAAALLREWHLVAAQRAQVRAVVMQHCKLRSVKSAIQTETASLNLPACLPSPTHLNLCYSDHHTLHVQGITQCPPLTGNVACRDSVQEGPEGHSQGLTAVVAAQSDTQGPVLVAHLCSLQSTPYHSQLCSYTLALAPCPTPVAARGSAEGRRKEEGTAGCSHARAQADGCCACTLARASP